jgi:glycosyltransferase involved in cell wall biosynthesis
LNLLTYVHLRNIYRSTGVGRVAREITENLAKQSDIHVEILADRGDHARVIDKVGAPWTEFPYHFMEHETSRQQALWYLLDRPTAETYWPEVDIAYCTAESYVPVRKAKLVVTSHDMQLFEREAHAMSRKLLQQRFKWWLLFRRLAKRVDFFHAISQFSADRMAHYFPEIKYRLRVVPNAVSPAFFNAPTEAGEKVLTRLGIEQRPYLLVPGGLHYRKNAELILRTWPIIREQRPDLALVVISHNSPVYVARAEALAPSLILGGFQEEEQLVALYSHAQAVWFPSRYEGFGMPVLEAMACGTPVVTSSTTALPEVAGGAAAALVHPDHANEHVDVLVALLENAEARTRFSEFGKARARQFTWNRSAELLAAEFASLL